MKKYYLLGEKLGHSYSPRIHLLLGNPDYSLKELPAEALGEFFRKREFAGVNVTVPYKEKVMPLLDEIDPGAEKIGCVNTVVNRSGRLTGYNTDIDGFIYLIRRSGIDPAGKQALILGSGGTSKTAKAALGRLGAGNITIVSRKGEVNYSNVYELCRDAEIIVNTTPLGMFPNVTGCPVEPGRFNSLLGIIDVVYNPAKTELMLRATESGLPVSGGLPMLVSQACRANELFFGETVPEKTTEDIIKSISNEMYNIALIGMPGSGKSTLGKMLAESLERKFYDTDSIIEEWEKAKIPDIFREKGEGYFRSLEAQVISELSKLSGVVISCGGGSPLLEENRRSLMRNSRIIQLSRPIEELEMTGRPLSENRDAVLKLALERIPIYNELCEARVEVSEHSDESLNRLLEILK